MYIGMHVTYPLVLCDFNQPWILWTNSRMKPIYQILWKSVQWEPSCSMRTNRQIDRQIDMTKLAFRNFAKTPKILYSAQIMQSWFRIVPIINNDCSLCNNVTVSLLWGGK